MNAILPRTVLRLTLAGVSSTYDDTPENSASLMGAYWTAKNSGDTTAKMERVTLPGIDTDTDADPVDDDGDEPTVQIPAGRNPLAGLPATGAKTPHYAVDTRVDVKEPTATGAGSVSFTGASGTVSHVAVQRIALQDEWAANAGFALPPPVYAAGTRCVDLGAQNFRAIRQSVDSMPTFAVAARMVADAIKAEDREDVVCHARDVRMTDDGRIDTDPHRTTRHNRLLIDFDAFRAFCHRTGNGAGATYLGDVPAQRRAMNVNADLAGADASYMFRTRIGASGAREIFATLSPGYGVFDADSVMALAAPHLQDTRAEVVYDGARLKATALWMPDHVVDLAAGDVFKAGVRITTSDVGGGSIKVDAVLWRNRCLNLIIVGSADVTTCRRVHKGEGRDIASDVDAGIRQARELIAPFLQSWGAARAATIAESEEQMKARIEAIVNESRGGVKATKAERETAIPAILNAWRAEPGFTVADLANALTRAAHESEDFVADYRSHLERRAGQLVLVGR